jgi:ABC-type transport system involved in multi-copper enzyme maturation permease subunit
MSTSIPAGGLLRYRPWRGELGHPTWAALAIARTALGLLLRRRLFWALYAICVLNFLFFFFGQYLQVWLEGQLGQQLLRVRLGGEAPEMRLTTDGLFKFLRETLKLNGTGETFRNYFVFQGSMLTIILALAGSILVGNDFHYGTLPFYLAKPIHRWHYIGGKCLAVGVFINLVATVPALVLFAQFGMLEDWNYYLEKWYLAVGILGYGLVLTLGLSPLLVATAVAVRRTVPLVMVWMTLFSLAPILASVLVDALQFSPRWRLIDIWNSTFLVGQWCLGIKHVDIKPDPQPEFWEAALALGAVVSVCLIYLQRRIRGVEIVR